jgi:hypothetical protein
VADEHKENDWNRYENLVLQELRRHSSVLEAMDSKVQALAVELGKYADHEETLATLMEANSLLRERVASLEMRSSIIGAASGFLAALGTGLVALIVTYLRK